MPESHLSWKAGNARRLKSDHSGVKKIYLSTEPWSAARVEAMSRLARGCLAAGTPVHTEDGLRPIEEITAGDWVLSKAEKTGEQAYKRVLSTGSLEPEVVMAVGLTLPNDVNKGAGRLITTLDLPFWVSGRGWTAACNLSRGANAGAYKFELCDGGQTVMRGSGLIYATGEPWIGWSPGHGSDLLRPGYLWDYRNSTLVAEDVMAVPALQEFAETYDHPLHDVPEHLLMKLPVHNLQLEDFNTYYVGKHGAWIHNLNCGGNWQRRRATLDSLSAIV